jgi:hypothetical protein
VDPRIDRLMGDAMYKISCYETQSTNYIQFGD